MTRSEADTVLTQLPALPLTRHPEALLIAAGFDIAHRRTGRFTTPCTSPWPFNSGRSW
jgi:hypothetical protein